MQSFMSRYVLPVSQKKPCPCFHVTGCSASRYPPKASHGCTWPHRFLLLPPRYPAFMVAILAASTQPDFIFFQRSVCFPGGSAHAPRRHKSPVAPATQCIVRLFSCAFTSSAWSSVSLRLASASTRICPAFKSTMSCIFIISGVQKSGPPRRMANLFQSPTLTFTSEERPSSQSIGADTL